MSIHPTAVIDSSAVVDPTAEVGAYAVIGPRVTVGPEVEIRPHAHIDKDTAIGRGSRIFSFASVGGDPQDLKYKGEPTSLIIGENVTIRESATVHRGTAGGGGTTVIGDGCLLMATVHVAHDCHLGPEVIMSSYAVLAGHISIGEGAIIGGLYGHPPVLPGGRPRFPGRLFRALQGHAALHGRARRQPPPGFVRPQRHRLEAPGDAPGHH